MRTSMITHRDDCLRTTIPPEMVCGYVKEWAVLGFGRTAVRRKAGGSRRNDGTDAPTRSLGWYVETAESRAPPFAVAKTWCWRTNSITAPAFKLFARIYPLLRRSLSILFNTNSSSLNILYRGPQGKGRSYPFRPFLRGTL